MLNRTNDKVDVFRILNDTPQINSTKPVLFTEFSKLSKIHPHTHNNSLCFPYMYIAIFLNFFPNISSIWYKIYIQYIKNIFTLQTKPSIIGNRKNINFFGEGDLARCYNWKFKITYVFSKLFLYSYVNLINIHKINNKYISLTTCFLFNLLC